eukprot:871985-Rhodomonas_salina.1
MEAREKGSLPTRDVQQQIGDVRALKGHNNTAVLPIPCGSCGKTSRRSRRRARSSCRPSARAEEVLVEGADCG